MPKTKDLIEELAALNAEKDAVRHALADEAEHALTKYDRTDDVFVGNQDRLRYFHRDYEQLLRTMASMLYRQTPKNDLRLNLASFRSLARRLVDALEYPKEEEKPAKKRSIKVPAKPVRKLNKALKKRKK